MTIKKIKDIVEKEKLRPVDFIHKEKNEKGELVHYFWSFRPNGNVEEYSFNNGDISLTRTIPAEFIY